MVPSTKDAIIILEELLNNENFLSLTDDQKIDVFKQELNKYLLFKMTYFKLDCKFYTIDNDFRLIIESLDELIDPKNKFYFFENIIILIINFISNILNQKIRIKSSFNKQLLGNPYFSQNDDYLEYRFYFKDTPSMIVINLYEFIENNLEDNLFEKYSSGYKYLQ